MITIENNRTGKKIEVPHLTAETVLKKAEAQKSRGQNYYKLPEDSKYRLYKGSLVVKEKKKEVD